ncbi:hypothetical protein D3C84_936850 [compost metagenome]
MRDHRQTIHLRNAQIQHDQIREQLADRFQCVHTVIDLRHDRVPFTFKHHPHRHTHQRVIIDDDYIAHGVYCS